jgi:signal transduction histidine kinase
MVLHSYELPLLTYHALSVTAAGVFLHCLGWVRTMFGSLLLVYALLGAALLGYTLSLDQSSQSLALVWRVMSVAVMAVLCVGMLWKFKSDAGVKQSLVAVGGLWGLSIVVEDLLMQAQGPLGLRTAHLFFGVFLLVLCLLMFGRLRWMRTPGPYVARAGHASTTQGPGFGNFSGFSLNSEAHSTHTFALSAVADERKRIAQDIHDGVGSQLVGLIASLDANSPLHKRLHVGLECCLLDLKMMVDNMDGGNTNIFDALGSLRYRFAPSLQRAGIRMVWRVDTAGPLLALPRTSVAHILRIVQECLANVLLHSEAKKVRVVCRYESEPPHMLLEVQDDGAGMAEAQENTWIGKGLSGIRERAKSLGAKIDIDTKQGVGTRVRLQVPVR